MIEHVKRCALLADHRLYEVVKRHHAVLGNECRGVKLLTRHLKRIRVDQCVDILDRADLGLLQQGDQPIDCILDGGGTGQVLANVSHASVPIGQFGKRLSNLRAEQIVEDLGDGLFALYQEPLDNRVKCAHQRLNIPLIVYTTFALGLGHKCRDHSNEVVLGGNLHALVHAKAGLIAKLECRVSVDGLKGIEQSIQLLVGVLRACCGKDRVDIRAVERSVLVKHRFDLFKSHCDRRIDQLKELLHIIQANFDRCADQGFKIPGRHDLAVAGFTNVSQHAVIVECRNGLADRLTVNDRRHRYVNENGVGAVLLVHLHIKGVGNAVHDIGNVDLTVAEIKGFGKDRAEHFLIGVKGKCLNVTRCGKTDLFHFTAGQAVAAAESRIDLGGLENDRPIGPCVTERGFYDLVTNGAGRSLGTGCDLIGLVSKGGNVLHVQHVMALGAFLIIPTAVFAVDLYLDHDVAVIVSELLYDLIKHLCAASTLADRVTVALAGSLNDLARGQIVVVSAAALHLLRFLICDCIEGEVLRREGDRPRLCVVDCGDRLDLTVVGNVPDHDTVGVLPCLQLVRQGNGNRLIKVLIKLLVVDGYAEIEDINVTQTLLLLLGKLRRVGKQIFLVLDHFGTDRNIGVSARLQLTDDFLRELDGSRLGGYAEVLVFGKRISLDLCNNVCGVEASDLMRTVLTLLRGPAVVTGRQRLILVNAGRGKRRALMIMANRTNVGYGACRNTGSGASALLFPFVLVVIDLDGQLLVRTARAGASLHSLFLTGGIEQYAPFTKGVTPRCFVLCLVAVDLVDALTVETGILGIGVLKTGHRVRDSTVGIGVMFLVLAHRAGGAGVRVGFTVKTVVVQIVMFHSTERFGHGISAGGTGDGFNTRGNTSGILGDLTFVPFVFFLGNGRTLRYDLGAGGTNGITRVAFLGAGRLDSTHKRGDRMGTRCGTVSIVVFITIGVFCPIGISCC